LAAAIVLSAFTIRGLNNMDFYLFYRIGEFFNRRAGGQKEIRDFEWESAINQFLSHPVLGDKYITDYDMYYPHNIYLEVLMSSGVIGGFLFFTGLMLVLVKILKVIRLQQQYLLPFCIVLVLVMFFRLTSGALYMSPDFWVMIGLIAAQTNFGKWNTISTLQ
jgi:O-antigen ligase